MTEPMRIIDSQVELALPEGRALSGQLEHSPTGHSLFLIDLDKEVMDPVVLTVSKRDAPDAIDALEPDQVLLRNWTELRGAPEALAEAGLVELTGEEVRVGLFGLQALVARVL